MKHNKVILDDRGKIKKSSPLHKVIFPSFEIYSSPTVHIADVKRRRFSLINRLVQKARQEIMAQEDEAIFRALDSISNTDIKE